MVLAFKSCGLCIKSGYIFVSSVVSRLFNALYELRRSPIAKQRNNPAIQCLVNTQCTKYQINNTVKHSNTKNNRFGYTTILAVIRDSDVLGHARRPSSCGTACEAPPKGDCSRSPTPAGSSARAAGPARSRSTPRRPPPRRPSGRHSLS